MHKGRLEAFSDGVLAIIITIMVLDLKIPAGTAQLSSLTPLWPVFLSYLLSFIYIGIYWNNHHHMLQTTPHIDGRVMWANLHLLFWLSLVPFTTGWMGENHFAPAPTAVYGFVLLMAAIAYWLLQQSILSIPGGNKVLQTAIGSDIKGKISPLLYILAVGLSFYQPSLACILYIAVAVMWLAPDPRIERALGKNTKI